MTKLVLVVAVLLLIGPLRRPFFKNGAFAVPAAVAGVACYFVGRYIVACAGIQSPIVALIPLAMALGAALGAGESAKAWCDRTLGRNGERRHDR